MSAPEIPYIEIRPRCSNASITYYFRSANTGTPASSFGLVYNGPAPELSNTVPPTWGYTATGLTNGAYYSSSVVAINQYGTSAPAYFRVVQPNGFPDPPQNLTSLINGNNLMLNWNFPSAPQTANIGWYVITDKLTSNRYNTLGNVSTISIVLNNNTPRQFCVQSVNDPGYSINTCIQITPTLSYSYYPMENSYLDSFGFHNMSHEGNTTFNNTVKIIGDYSLEFDSSNSYVSLQNNFTQTGFTWVGWIYPMSSITHTLYNPIVAFENTFSSNYLFLYNQINANFFGFQYNINFPSGPADAIYCAAELNKWNHIAVSFGDQFMRIYRDGNIEASTNISSLNLQNFYPVSTFMGKSDFVGSDTLLGYLDDVGIYTNVLSAEQISTIYYTQSTLFTSLSSINIG